MLCAAAVLLLLFVFHPQTAYAERYYDTYDDYSVDINNHLREDCWVHDGSFVYYTEEGYTSTVGVDVSKWNGDIDWYALKEQGIEFAIIRVGFRGYETGELVLDERFYDYMDGASAAGLQVGVYFYSQAIDEDEAIEEAQFVINHIAGYYLSLPVYFDTEEVRLGESRTDVMAVANYTINALAFCSTIEAQGYRAGIYSSNEWIRKNLDMSRLACYEIWYALYGNTPGKEYGFDMWQYTEQGDLYGTESYLDMNVRVQRLW